MTKQPIHFNSGMAAMLFKTLKPEAGDFFLTASKTQANITVRDYSGSKYGHGLLYLGKQEANVMKTASGAMFGFPRTSEPHCAFELPINCTGLEKILAKDKCFMLAHVSPKSFSKAQKDRLMYLCAGFVGAKYTKGEVQSGYSDQMALIYALGDTLAHHFGGVVVPQKYNPAALVGRGATKLLNETVQNGIQLYEGYPNLNCTSLISWMYKQLGNPILGFSTTVSPYDLYNAVKDSKKFVMKEYNFNNQGPVAM